MVFINYYIILQKFEQHWKSTNLAICSWPQPCTACMWLLWAAQGWIPSRNSRLRKKHCYSRSNCLQPGEAFCSTSGVCSACSGLQEAGLHHEHRTQKKLQQFQLLTTYWSRVPFATSFSGLQEAGLCPELRRRKRQFVQPFQLREVYWGLCSPQWVAMSCGKLDCIMSVEKWKVFLFLQPFQLLSTYKSPLKFAKGSYFAGSWIASWNSKARKCYWSLVRLATSWRKLQEAAWHQELRIPKRLCVQPFQLPAASWGLVQLATGSKKNDCVINFEQSTVWFFSLFQLPQAHWSLVRPGTSCRELQEARLCHELRKRKSVFLQSFPILGAYWSLVEPTTSSFRKPHCEN